MAFNGSFSLVIQDGSGSISSGDVTIVMDDDYMTHEVQMSCCK